MSRIGIQIYIYISLIIRVLATLLVITTHFRGAKSGGSTTSPEFNIHKPKAPRRKQAPVTLSWDQGLGFRV